MMKKNYVLILLSTIATLVCFAIMYLLFHSGLKESLIASVSVLISGLIIDFLRIGKPKVERK